MKIGRVTLSDRASTGVYFDKSGPEIERVLREQFAEPVEFACVLLPDEQPQIEAALRQLAAAGCCLPAIPAPGLASAGPRPVGAA